METSSSISYKLNWEGGHIETVYLWWNRDRRRKNIKIKKRAKNLPFWSKIRIIQILRYRKRFIISFFTGDDDINSRRPYVQKCSQVNARFGLREKFWFCPSHCLFCKHKITHDYWVLGMEICKDITSIPGIFQLSYRICIVCILVYGLAC